MVKRRRLENWKIEDRFLGKEDKSLFSCTEDVGFGLESNAYAYPSEQHGV